MISKFNEPSIMPGLQVRPQAGFSLIEVMISLGMFMVIVASSYTALSQGLIVSQNSRLESMANAWISTELEEMRSLSWDDVEKLDEKGMFKTPPPDQRLEAVKFVQMRKDGQYIVKLEVLWQSAQGNDRRLSVVTFLSRNGLGRLS